MGVALNRDRMFTPSAEDAEASHTFQRRGRVKRTTAAPGLRNLTGTPATSKPGCDGNFPGTALAELRNFTRTAAASEPGRDGNFPGTAAAGLRNFTRTAAASKLRDFTGAPAATGFASGLRGDGPEGLSSAAQVTDCGGEIRPNAYA